MNERDYQTYPTGGGAGLAVLLLTAAAGAAAYLLATKPGRALLGQFSGLAEEWKTQAAATLAETREEVVTSVEEGDGAGGGRVRVD
jgi:hypothetical protein